MRRVTAGLGSLAIAAGLTSTVAAAPPVGTTTPVAQTDDLPNPASTLVQVSDDASGKPISFLPTKFTTCTVMPETSQNIDDVVYGRKD